MLTFIARLKRLIGLTVCLILTISAARPTVMAEESKPIRALLILGGCCHDYKEQQTILTKGIAARVNVQWAIGYDPDTGTTHLNPWYEKDDWAKGFDVVVHDECCSDVKDIKTVEKILKPHRWNVKHGGRTYHEVPLGEHGRRKNPEIETGHIRGLVRFFEIPESCYSQFLDLS